MRQQGGGTYTNLLGPSESTEVTHARGSQYSVLCTQPQCIQQHCSSSLGYLRCRFKPLAAQVWSLCPYIFQIRALEGSGGKRQDKEGIPSARTPRTVLQNILIFQYFLHCSLFGQISRCKIGQRLRLAGDERGVRGVGVATTVVHIPKHRLHEAHHSYTSR